MQVNGPEKELYLRLVRPEWTKLSHGLLAVRHQSHSVSQSSVSQCHCPPPVSVTVLRQSVSQSSVSQCHCRCRELFR